MNKFILLVFCLISYYYSYPQRITKEQYIESYKDLAIREMKRMGVPAAITLAQGLLESEGGNSELLKKSNNHFGIKCKETWSAAGVTHDDDAKGECFRYYKSAEDSYRDHSNFLRSRSWYAPLFRLDPTDYKGWAYGLKKAGYATNPRYPEILIKFIEDNNLQQYSLIAMNEVPHFDASKYKDDPEVNVSEANEEKTDKGSKKMGPSTGTAAKEIYINNTKAIWVLAGTSLLAVATEHHLNLDKLLEYNDLSYDGLLTKDQYLFIERKSKEGSIDFYSVQENEQLWDIAQKAGIRLQKLMEYNNLKETDSVKPGSKLYLNTSKHISQTTGSIPDSKINR